VLVKGGKVAFYSVDKGVKAVGRAVEERDHHARPTLLSLPLGSLPTKTWLYPQLSTSYPHLGGKAGEFGQSPFLLTSDEGFPLPTLLSAA
jgi:hypothetical protein